MAETLTTPLQKLDAALRITVAIVGTLPMTAMLLSVLAHGLFGGSDLSLALAPILLLPAGSWPAARCSSSRAACAPLAGSR